MGYESRLGFEVGLHDGRFDQSEVFLGGSWRLRNSIPSHKIVFF
jgi:hypothetical protein